MTAVTSKHAASACRTVFLAAIGIYPLPEGGLRYLPPRTVSARPTARHRTDALLAATRAFFPAAVTVSIGS